jgi:6-phosphogluconolactonase
MKFTKFGQIVLALVTFLGLSIGVTSCANDYTIAYLYVTGDYQNQIGAFKIANNTGSLSAIPGSPYGSGGTNPIRDVISTSGSYLYILNAGVLQSDGTYSGANIATYSIGGNGALAPQLTYASQGLDSIRLSFSSGGGFLYVLDEFAPQKDASGNIVTSSPVQNAQFPCPARDPSQAGTFYPTGDITAFSADSSTGRLSLITNNQQQDPVTGAQLTYFPVGCYPIDFKVTAAYIFTADNGPEPGTTNYQTVFAYAQNTSNGQLTLTQNSELVTGAQQISTIGSNSSTSYIYILDSGANQILPYTIGSGGILQAVNNGITSNSQSVAGNPVALTSDSKNKFLYVANAGPSTSPGNANSDISGYIISSNGVPSIISGAPFTTGSGPQCIIEDPSSQYIYTVDFNSSTVTGHILDPNSGVLTPLRSGTSYATVQNPTWFVATGHTD